MDLSLQLHNAINRANVLTKPTNTINEYLKKHPTLFKVVLLVNHVFRALAMMFFMTAAPLAICFAASLFYRLTVETNCAYKFALPAFGGAMAFPIAQAAIADFISKAAFSSLETFAIAASSLLPMAVYLSYVVLTVSYDVDKNCPPPRLKKSCCSY